MNDEKILIVDSDFGFASNMQDMLNKNGYTCMLAMSHQKAMDLALKSLPALIFCEVDLPEKDGVEIVRDLRGIGMLRSSLIVMMSNRGDNFLQILAYNSGADDFLVKPISERLLLAKVQSLLRRVNGFIAQPNAESRASAIRIDYERYLVIRGLDEIELPKKEFEILSLLYKNPKRVYSRDEIKDEIWKTNDNVKSRTIDVHIKKLREKIGENLIKTIKGVGYKFEQS